MTATIHLVRHGQSDWNVARRLQGQRDEPVLTELGRRQAAEAAELLRPLGVTTVLSSDLQRAVQTAEILGAAFALPVSIDRRLREQSLGKIEGFGMQEALDATTGHDWTDADAALPAGESLGDVAARLEPLLAAAQQGLFGARVVMVSHGDTIRVAMALLGAISLSEIQHGCPANGSITTF